MYFILHLSFRPSDGTKLELPILFHTSLRQCLFIFLCFSNCAISINSQVFWIFPLFSPFHYTVHAVNVWFCMLSSKISICFFFFFFVVFTSLWRTCVFPLTSGEFNLTECGYNHEADASSANSSSGLSLLVAFSPWELARFCQSFVCSAVGFWLVPWTLCLLLDSGSY